MYAFYAAAAIALVSIGADWKRSKAALPLTILTLLLAAGTLGVGAYIALRGRTHPAQRVPLRAGTQPAHAGASNTSIELRRNRLPDTPTGNQGHPMACPGLSYVKLAPPQRPSSSNTRTATIFPLISTPLHVAPFKAVTSSVPNVFIGEHRCVELRAKTFEPSCKVDRVAEHRVAQTVNRADIADGDLPRGKPESRGQLRQPSERADLRAGFFQPVHEFRLQPRMTGGKA